MVSHLVGFGAGARRAEARKPTKCGGPLGVLISPPASLPAVPSDSCFSESVSACCYSRLNVAPAFDSDLPRCGRSPNHKSIAGRSDGCVRPSHYARASSVESACGRSRASAVLCQTGSPLYH